MNVVPTELQGLSIVQPRVFSDHRGSFVKTYHEGMFKELGIDLVPREEFFSVSKRDVVRGMHFQVPPMAQPKVVYCISGGILDVVLDLRKSSPTYGKYFSRELTEANREMLFIPSGFAHGFVSLSDPAVVVYQAGQVHSAPHDTGIAWDSFGFNWPVKDPILADRDKKFPSLKDFQSPF